MIEKFALVYKQVDNFLDSDFIPKIQNDYWRYGLDKSYHGKMIKV
jgi:hypothetical protein